MGTLKQPALLRCLFPFRALRTLPTDGTATSGQDFPHLVLIYRNRSMEHCEKPLSTLENKRLIHVNLKAGCFFDG